MHNKEKFEELFRNNYESMLRLAMLMLKDDEEAKDVVGDIFAALWDGAIHTDVDRPEGYLARCVRNRCLDLLGHRKVEERVGRLLMLDTSTVVITEKYEQEELARLRMIIDTLLTERDRQVLRMKYERKMKYREIADELQISQVAVFKHLSQALKTLKSNFK